MKMKKIAPLALGLMVLGASTLQSGQIAFAADTVVAETGTIPTDTDAIMDVAEVPTDVAEDPADVTATQSNPVSISHKRKTLTVQLEENATTGYEWSVKNSNKKVLKVGKSTYAEETTYDEEDLVGVGGMRTMTFKGLKKGTAVLKFTEKQQWKGGDTENKFQITVKVDKNGKITSAVRK